MWCLQRRGLPGSSWRPRCLPSRRRLRRRKPSTTLMMLWGGLSPRSAAAVSIVPDYVDRLRCGWKPLFLRCGGCRWLRFDAEPNSDAEPHARAQSHTHSNADSSPDAHANSQSAANIGKRVMFGGRTARRGCSRHRASVLQHPLAPHRAHLFPPHPLTRNLSMNNITKLAVGSALAALLATSAGASVQCDNVRINKIEQDDGGVVFLHLGWGIAGICSVNSTVANVSPATC
jgi:hypothetical protein